MAKNKKHIGEIYYVNPRHLIKPSEWSNYVLKRGVSKRPVAVTIQNSGKRVQVSQITHQSTQNQIERNQRIKMENTFRTNGTSYLNTDTVSKSKLTKKKFVIGKAPLKKTTKKVDQKDLETYFKARKRRGR